MAESTVGPGQPVTNTLRPPPVSGAARAAPSTPIPEPAGAVRAYLLLVRIWTRAAWQYPASLATLGLAQLVVTGLDFAAIAIVFAHVPALAGFGIAEVMFLYGTSGTAFALTELVLGNVDRLGRHIRAGTFDVMLTRPVHPLVQVAAEDFSPRRLGELLQAGAVLVAGLVAAPIAWDPGRVLFVPLMIGCGMVIYSSIFVLGTTIQFAMGDAAEFMNSFTYGGKTLNQYPLAIYGRNAVRLLTYLVPLSFVNWLPALYVLDRPDPLGLPGVLRFAAPVVAALLVVLAAAAWRAGIRHYRSTGS